MTRPRSILTFERLFLLALLLWIAQQALTWSTRVAQFESNPAGQGRGVVLAGFLVAMALANVGIWYLAARAGSVVGKWLAVAAAVVSAILLIVEVLVLLQPGGPGVPFKLLALVTSALTVAAAIPLFRDDAREWFGEGTDDTMPADEGREAEEA